MCVCSRKVTKESLVETSGNITESLMSISRMMAEQVKQSEDTIGSLGKRTILIYIYVDSFAFFLMFSGLLPSQLKF